MPEGDTVHRTAAVLRPALSGKPVLRFHAPALLGPPPRTGAVIEYVESRGRHLELGFDDGLVLHTPLRLGGTWDLYRPGERWRRRAGAARVVLQVEGWLAVCFRARLVETYREEDRRRHPGLGTLGPDLTRGRVDVAEALSRMARFATVHQTIADVLLDQRIVSGVGNVCKSETLWVCRVDPFTPIELLGTARRRQIIDTAARLLRRDAFDGDRSTITGGLAVYGRMGKPCLRCHAPIQVRRTGDHARYTYWCPDCQLRPPVTGPAPQRVSTRT